MRLPSRLSSIPRSFSSSFGDLVATLNITKSQDNRHAIDNATPDNTQSSPQPPRWHFRRWRNNRGVSHAKSSSGSSARSLTSSTSETSPHLELPSFTALEAPMSWGDVNPGIEQLAPATSPGPHVRDNKDIIIHDLRQHVVHLAHKLCIVEEDTHRLQCALSPEFEGKSSLDLEVLNYHQDEENEESPRSWEDEEYALDSHDSRSFRLRLLLRPRAETPDPTTVGNPAWNSQVPERIRRHSLPLPAELRHLAASLPEGYTSRLGVDGHIHEVLTRGNTELQSQSTLEEAPEPIYSNASMFAGAAQTNYQCISCVLEHDDVRIVTAPPPVEEALAEDQSSLEFGIYPPIGTEIIEGRRIEAVDAATAVAEQSVSVADTLEAMHHGMQTSNDDVRIVTAPPPVEEAEDQSNLEFEIYPPIGTGIIGGRIEAVDAANAVAEQSVSVADTSKAMHHGIRTSRSISAPYSVDVPRLVEEDDSLEERAGAAAGNLLPNHPPFVGTPPIMEEDPSSEEEEDRSSAAESAPRVGRAVFTWRRPAYTFGSIKSLETIAEHEDVGFTDYGDTPEHSPFSTASSRATLNSSSDMIHEGADSSNTGSDGSAPATFGDPQNQINSIPFPESSDTLLESSDMLPRSSDACMKKSVLKWVDLAEIDETNPDAPL